jgi:membrane associated rhomboid family serine protease
VNEPGPHFVAEPAIEVYRSRARVACDERAFMLHAVGIASQLVTNGHYWSLIVAPDDAANALFNLRRYEKENAPVRRFVRPEGSHAHAWIGAACYAIVLLVVSYLAGYKYLGVDWLDVGSLQARAVRSGEVWRAFTALTLHFDVAHLLGNLGFGMFFGWLAAQLLGPGVAWAGAVAAAASANLCNGLVQPANHLSAGASTCVFAMLGLLAAYAWRRRADAGERWAYRWAPLIAGVFMLGFTGVGGENTDVLAHLSGFVAGLVAGALLALRQHMFGTPVQWVCGLATLGALAGAWALALAHALS